MFCSLCNIYCSISENLFSVLKKILKINIYILFFGFIFFISKKIWTFSRFLRQVVIKACSALSKDNRTGVSCCIYAYYVCFLCHFQPSRAL